ncbi:DUF4360 domain-containing protein [Actinomadura sp. NEAU-AAG7]|uniref:DUF4360 domain-containing protein n=1 Tax=Actinomadura sp. NEAU-AAG7 TaxID=2839640 RepID=UPI001BE49C93|nr:DUF4360 domain-containing protein [Actinomadura sp. NEAU-AAG7]MBT2207355.1 DUF4360 domain-containing protein [Actinomadura sp. NEAU-AAG7]
MKAALAAIGGTALPLLTALPASADPPPRVSIHVASARGCGGNMGADILLTPPSVEGFGIRIYLPLMTVSAGKGVPAEEARKTCDIALIINLPLKYTWALKSTRISGIADLDPEATGEVAHGYRLQGKDPGREISHPIKAPQRSWRFEDETPLEHPCVAERAVTLSTRLQVKAADTAKVSWISMEEYPDTRTEYTFTFKPCHP